VSHAEEEISIGGILEQRIGTVSGSVAYEIAIDWIVMGFKIFKFHNIL
jgi:hypothetical protein